MSPIRFAKCFETSESYELQYANEIIVPSRQVEVIAGLPKNLIVVDWPLDVPKMIYNEKSVDKMVCQVVDAWGNYCPDNGINVRLTKQGDAVKLEPSPKPDKTKNGLASFGPFKASGFSLL